MSEMDNNNLLYLLEKVPIYFDSEKNGEINPFYYNFCEKDIDFFFTVCNELKKLDNKYNMVNFKLLEEWLVNLIMFTKLDINNKSRGLQVDNLYHTPLSISLKNGYVNVVNSILDRPDLDINIEYKDINGNKFPSVSAMWDNFNHDLFSNGIYKKIINNSRLILDNEEYGLKMINAIINYIDNDMKKYITINESFGSKIDIQKRCHLFIEAISLLYTLLHALKSRGVFPKGMENVVEVKCKDLKREIGYMVERIY